MLRGGLRRKLGRRVRNRDAVWVIVLAAAEALGFSYAIYYLTGRARVELIAAVLVWPFFSFFWMIFTLLIRRAEPSPQPPPVPPMETTPAGVPTGPRRPSPLVGHAIPPTEN
jgi:hypothetical protein